MTAALEGGEWSAARLGRTLPPAKTRYPFYRRLGRLQGRSGRAETLVPTGIQSRTFQSVVSRYTYWATRPIYIHVCVCVCVCVWYWLERKGDILHEICKRFSFLRIFQTSRLTRIGDYVTLQPRKGGDWWSHANICQSAHAPHLLIAEQQRHKKYSI